MGMEGTLREEKGVLSSTTRGLRVYIYMKKTNYVSTKRNDYSFINIIYSRTLFITMTSKSITTVMISN